jgi:23S rRNA (adenine2503-C2)-methyltransferase
MTPALPNDAPHTGAGLDLAGLLPAEIAKALDLQPYQGKQIFRWIHQKKVFDFEQMTDLSKALRDRLAAACRVSRLRLVRTEVSATTETRKALLELTDGETVEAVMIPARDRVTLCLSTQAGCAVKCSFCATGLSGFARNLTAGEIVEQALYLLREVDLGGRSPNIVFMGMGEPFRNYDATIKAIHLLMHPDGLGIGARRITVSTAGEADGIRRFAEEDWQVRLSVSLHAANDALRDELVPLNRRYNLAKLMEAVDYYLERTGRQITFEWTLLAEVNDTSKDAEELAQLVGGRPIHVNLIPYNPVGGTPYAAPGRKRAESFRDALTHRGIGATLRLERGQDISAACGQLRRKSLEGVAADNNTADEE